MEEYGPLFQRNRARVWSSFAARAVLTVAILIGVCELVFGIVATAQLHL